MDKTQYADYEARFAKGMDGLEFFSTDTDSEPFFSWHACDICGTTLGGNRTIAYAHSVHVADDSRMEGLRVCDDCVYYAEYGRLDDMTMMEVEESA